MDVSIHFYSLSKDLAGESEITLAVPQSATLSDAVELLYEQIPALLPIRSSVLYAVGLDYATMETPLAPGAMISVIPPVQGG